MNISIGLARLRENKKIVGIVSYYLLVLYGLELD